MDAGSAGPTGIDSTDPAATDSTRQTAGPRTSSGVGPFPARLQRFGRVDSTQSVVASWLAEGAPDVCVAVADEQTAGRGRQGRTWVAPPGSALMLSIGFRPTWLAPRDAWRIPAIVALAMADAAEEAAGLRDGTLGLKWPNDLVVEGPEGRLLKVAGVLGESTTLGARLETAIVGVGVNVEWAASDFPADLSTSMTSLSEASGGRPVDREALLEAFLDRLEPRYEALRQGRFDSGGWDVRQRTTGRRVVVEVGRDRIEGTGEGVDSATGALLVRTAGRVLAIDTGEVVRCRVADGGAAR